MIRLFFALSIALFAALPVVHAETAKVQPDFSKLDPVLRQVYRDLMDKQFINIINLAKKNKLTRDFFAELFALPADSADRKFLQGKFGEVLWADSPPACMVRTNCSI